MANDQLFIDVLAQIEREPERWDQSLWRFIDPACGTSFCMAGWTCELSGVKWSNYDGGVADHSKLNDGERVWAVASRALVGYSAGRLGPLGLFDISNKLPDLYGISADLMGIDEQVLRDKVQDALR